MFAWVNWRCGNFLYVWPMPPYCSLIPHTSSSFFPNPIFPFPICFFPASIPAISRKHPSCFPAVPSQHSSCFQEASQLFSCCSQAVSQLLTGRSQLFPCSQLRLFPHNTPAILGPKLIYKA